MKQTTKKLLSALLALAMAFTFAIAPADATQAAKKQNYLTRLQAVKLVNELFGITQYSDDKMSGIKDVNYGTSTYKTMAKAVNARLVSPDSNGKLKPKAKATYQYVAEMFAAVDDSTAAEMLGQNKANAKLTAAKLKKYIKKCFPTVLSSSTSKVANGNVVINKPGVTLSNLTVDGDLIVGDGVGTGEATLDNVTVTGKVVVRGGGENSFIIKGASSISNLIVEVINNKISVKSQDNAKIELVRVRGDSDDVKLEGNVNSVVLDCPGITVSLSNATVNSVTLSEKAKGASIKLDKGSNVSNITMNAEGSKISGDGNIETVTVNAANTSIDAPSVDASKVTVSDGANNVKVNGQDPSAASQNSGNAGTTPSTGNGGGSANTSPAAGNTSSGNASNGNTSNTSTSNGSSSGSSSSGSSSSGGSSSRRRSSSSSSSSNSSSSDSSSGNNDSSSESSSGSNSSSNSGSSSSTIEYKTDSRFAKDYPKYERDEETNQIKVTYKLADSVDVSEEKYVELYTVNSPVFNNDSSFNTNSTAVMHGHLGITEGTSDHPFNPGILNSRYHLFTSHAEVTFTYSDPYGEYFSFAELSVLKDAAGNVSEVPTIVGNYAESTGSSSGYAESTGNNSNYAYLNAGFLDETGTKLYAYVRSNEKLKTNSSYDAKSFSVNFASSGNQTMSAADAIRVISCPDTAKSFANLTSCIELTFNQPLSPDDGYMILSYHKPDSNPITTESGYELSDNYQAEVFQMKNSNVFYTKAADSSGYYVGIHLFEDFILYALNGTYNNYSNWLVEINGLDYPVSFYTRYLKNIPDQPKNVYLKLKNQKIIGYDCQEHDKIEIPADCIQEAQPAQIMSAQYDTSLKQLIVEFNEKSIAYARKNTYPINGDDNHLFGCAYVIKDPSKDKSVQEHLIRGFGESCNDARSVIFSEDQLASIGITEANMNNLTLKNVTYDSWPEAGLINLAGMPVEPEEVKVDVVSSEIKFTFESTPYDVDDNLDGSTQENPAIVEDTNLQLTLYAWKQSSDDSTVGIDGNVPFKWSIKNVTNGSNNTVTIRSNSEYYNGNGEIETEFTASGFSSDVYELTLNFGGLTKNYYIKFLESGSEE